MKLNLPIKLAILLLTVLFQNLNAQNQASILWARQFKGQYDADIVKMKFDATGNLYVFGTFIDLTDFDLSNTTASRQSGNYEDVFVAKYGPTGNLLWSAHFNGGSTNDRAYDLVVLPNGGITVTGLFDGNLDADPGPGTAMLMASGGASLFMVTLDAAGQYQWSYQWSPGSGFAYTGSPSAMALSPSGNIVMIAQCIDQTDIDPTSAVQLGTGTPTAGGAFLNEISPSGALIRAVSWNWVLSEYEDLVISPSGQLHLAGNVRQSMGTFDADFGPGSFLVNIQSRNAFLHTFDLATLALVDWKQVEGPGNSYSHGLARDLGGNLYWSVSFKNTVDINPLQSMTQNQTAVWGFDAVLYAFTPQFGLIWSHVLAGNGDDVVQSIGFDTGGNLFFGGTLHGTVDLDPGPGIANLTSSGNRDGYMFKWTPSGQYMWAQRVGTANDDYGSAIAVDAYGDVYMAGRFIGTGDFDPGTAVYNMLSTGVYDAFVAKYSQAACGNFGGHFSNYSSPTCNVPGSATFVPAGGTAPYSFVWDDNSTSPSITESDQGTRSVTISDAGGCITQRAVHFYGPSSQSLHDHEVYFQNPALRENILQPMHFRFRNAACLPANAQLVLRFDTRFSTITPYVAPDSVVGQDYYFNLGMLGYSPMHPSLQVDIRPNFGLSIGDRLLVQARILPEIGDFNAANNLVFDSIPIVAPFDPNDKRVLPGGACEEKFVDSDEDLTYVVRFQNTGNAEAYDVYVLDSLDPALDLSTLRVIDFSHPLVVEVLPGNVLKFRFDGIMLPDSNTNEPGSHGHFAYKIRPHTGTPDGTLARNRADIYFDFNPPILTNTTQNTLVEVVPACEAPLGATPPSGHLRVYPNPSAGAFRVEAVGLEQVEVWDLGGRMVWKGDAPGDLANVDLSRLPKGLYVLKVQFGGQVEALRIVLE